MTEQKNLNKLASQLTKREGKKSSVKIGDMREILHILASMILEDQDVVTCKKGGVVATLCLYAKSMEDRGMRKHKKAVVRGVNDLLKR